MNAYRQRIVVPIDAGYDLASASRLECHFPVNMQVVGVAEMIKAPEHGVGHVELLNYIVRVERLGEVTRVARSTL